jgi:hypothetical protein
VKFCGLPLGAIVKDGCAVGEKRLQSTTLIYLDSVRNNVNNCLSFYCMVLVSQFLICLFYLDVAYLIAYFSFYLFLVYLRTFVSSSDYMV